MHPPTVFISYSRQDRPYAEELAHRLDKAGLSAWFDSKIPPGQAWPNALERELSGAGTVILLLTAKGVESTFVQKEILFALSEGKRIIPLLLEAVALPLLVRDFQFVDARNGRDPLPEILSAFECVQGQEAPVPPSMGGRGASRPSSLGLDITSFVGRKRETRAISNLLRAPRTRVVTITGPPGVGKTRQALRIGARLGKSFPGGIWFASLAQAREPEDVAQYVAAALGVARTPQKDPSEVLVTFLSYRSRSLLILDNYEHLVDNSGFLVDLWQSRLPKTKFLVTSRRLLRLAGEREFPLPPMDVPPATGVPEVERIGAFDSISLFIERAREVCHGFRLEPQNAPSIVDICRRMEGIPLALELAAARLKVMDTRQLAARVDRSLELLWSLRRDGDARHHTLLSAIDWSFCLLAPWEREAFLQLSIFKGSFSIEAAEGVVDLSIQSGAPPVLEVVEGLCENNLVRFEPTCHGTRLSLLVPIQQYAQFKLQETRGPERQRDLSIRHAAFFGQCLDVWAARVDTESGGEALERIELDKENFLSAQAWFLDHDPVAAAKMALSLVKPLRMRDSAKRREEILERSLAVLPDSEKELRGWLLVSASTAFQDLGRGDRASQALQEAAGLATQAGSPLLLASSLNRKAEVEILRGNHSLALDFLAEARKALDGLDLSQERVDTEILEGSARRKLGEVHCAIELFEEARELASRIGNSRKHAQSSNALGLLLMEDLSEFPQSIVYLRQAEEKFGQIKDEFLLAGTLNNIGIAFMSRGDLEQAEQYYYKAEVLNRRLGNEWWLAANIHNRGQVLSNRGRLGEALQCYREAEKINRQTDNKEWLIKNLFMQGSALRKKGEYSRAAVLYEQAEGLCREKKDDLNLALVLNSSGLLLREVGEHQKALCYFADAEAVNLKLGRKASRAMNIGNRGFVLHALADFAEAIECYLAAEEILQGVGIEGDHAWFRCLRANSLREMGDLGGSLSLLQEAEDVYRRNGNYSDLAFLLVSKGLTLARLGREPEALQVLESALALLGDVEASETIVGVRCRAALAELRERAGDFAGAVALASAASSLAVQLGLADLTADFEVARGLATIRRLALGGLHRARTRDRQAIADRQQQEPRAASDQCGLQTGDPPGRDQNRGDQDRASVGAQRNGCAASGGGRAIGDMRQEDHQPDEQRAKESDAKNHTYAESGQSARTSTAPRRPRLDTSKALTGAPRLVTAPSARETNPARASENSARVIPGASRSR